MTRIGVFGGTFSPPHLGHRDLALLAAKQLQLDMIYIMPCQFPPHKESCISTFHRLNMLRLLFAEYDIFRFDFSEILREAHHLPIYRLKTGKNLTQTMRFSSSWAATHSPPSLPGIIGRA